MDRSHGQVRLHRDSFLARTASATNGVLFFALSVTSLASTPDGSIVVSGSADKTIRFASRIIDVSHRYASVCAGDVVVILVVGWRMFCDVGSCCCCCLIRIRCRQSVERVHWQSNRSRPCSHRRRVSCGDTGGFEPLDVRMYFVSISRGFSFPGFFLCITASRVSPSFRLSEKKFPSLRDQQVAGRPCLLFPCLNLVICRRQVTVWIVVCAERSHYRWLRCSRGSACTATTRRLCRRRCHRLTAAILILEASIGITQPRRLL